MGLEWRTGERGGGRAYRKADMGSPSLSDFVGERGGAPFNSDAAEVGRQLLLC